MNIQNEKCVMVMDESLPIGMIANTAAIMGITLGKQIPGVVGADVADQSGNHHLGIIAFSDLTVVDFSDLAQGCKAYDEFIVKMAEVPESSLQYFGLAICGAKKKVNKLTGSMPLLR